jgi:hypothetical protein
MEERARKEELSCSQLWPARPISRSQKRNCESSWRRKARLTARVLSPRFATNSTKPKPSFQAPVCACSTQFERHREAKSGHFRQRYVRSSGIWKHTQLWEQIHTHLRGTPAPGGRTSAAGHRRDHRQPKRQEQRTDSAATSGKACFDPSLAIQMWNSLMPG